MADRSRTAPADPEAAVLKAPAPTVEQTVTTDPTPPAAPEVAPEVEVEQEAVATIKSVNVDEYPIHVGVAQGEYTFENAEQTYEVPLAVAEQFTYVPVIAVVE